LSGKNRREKKDTSRSRAARLNSAGFLSWVFGLQRHHAINNLHFQRNQILPVFHARAPLTVLVSGTRKSKKKFLL
jgi:hypothetical protein